MTVTIGEFTPSEIPGMLDVLVTGSAGGAIGSGNVHGEQGWKEDPEGFVV